MRNDVIYARLRYISRFASLLRHSSFACLSERERRPPVSLAVLVLFSDDKLNAAKPGQEKASFVFH